MPSPLDKIRQKASSVSIAQLLKQVPDIRGTDYDIEGYYADHGIPYKSIEDMVLSHAITGAHYSDEDKMPWHTSFSNHSKYSDSDMEGGKWQQGGSEGSELWNFTPSEINMEYNSPEAYKRMWLENQPKGTFISLPNGDVIEGNEGKYADGGLVEYNPITVDQIIDATHQELGIGRYAEGGSVNKMQAIPQNENLAALAEALSKGRDIANKVDIPYLGGVGDLLVGKTPEEIENWSYGNAPMQIPEMSNLPQFKKGRGESFADAATTLLPLAKGTKDVPAGLSFIGPNSKGWDKVAAELAAKKLDEGVDPEQVWQEHLIGRLPSGHVFSEISDKEVPFSNPSNEEILKYKTYKPEMLLPHDELLDLYPNMNEYTRIAYNPDYPEGSASVLGSTVTLSPSVDKSTLLHELQHMIQFKEGWPVGTNPGQMNADVYQQIRTDEYTSIPVKIQEAIKKYHSSNDGIEKQKIKENIDSLRDRSREMSQQNQAAIQNELYRRHTGEAQARATQDRVNMDMEQRRENYPLAGDKLSDISIKDLINKYTGSDPSMSASSDNLNADLLEKYLVTGKLSPEEMALYEDNALMMEDPNLQRYNLENARAQIPDDLDRMVATEFTTPSYHASREGEDIYEFDNRISDPSLFNGLGVHSGTKAAAIQRANDTTGVNRKTGKKNPDMATYYPLQLRANKSFEINSKPTNEYGAEIHLDSLGSSLGMGRESEKGRAAIQDAYFKDNDVLKYINDVEDKGSVSYISPPENIRSRFAAFDPLRKDSTSILANVLGGTALGDLALKYRDNEDVGYANGGSVEYNPIKIDQIIDATHKELGTGRYADGGSVNTTLQLG
jgi:hypothetical protein